MSCGDTILLDNWLKQVQEAMIIPQDIISTIKSKPLWANDSLVRICVCGGRDFNDVDKLADTMYQLTKHHAYSDVIIFGGEAQGADMYAKGWALENSVKYEGYPADWGKYGKSAGPIRNKQMLDTGIDVLVAFPGGKGTTNMVDICEKAGVYVYKVDWPEEISTSIDIESFMKP